MRRFPISSGSSSADLNLYADDLRHFSASSTMRANKSPEPTGVAAASCPRRFGLFIVAGRPWLSFFR